MAKTKAELRVEWIGALVGLGIMALLVVGGWRLCCSGGSQREPDNTGTQHDAEQMIQLFVKKRLKSPGTATFPAWGARAELPKEDRFPSFIGRDEKGNARWKWNAWVDAQNAFGGVVRTRFSAIVKKRGTTDNWEVESLVIH